MSITRAAMIAVAFLFGILLSVYLYIHGLASALFQESNKLSMASCEDALSTSKVNPNKMLFISCGGFLE